ncbi:MAG TPA: FAD-binding protein [Novosphingobium sp.]|nr:FAD-binding protein [Novosphingobium sp.]
MATGQFDEEFDFVVVGSGGGSMAAGLVMRQAGKSVLILEKTEYLGGTTARSGGVMWIPNNPFMAQEGVEDSYEKAMTYLDATAGQSLDAPGASKARRSAYVTEGPKMVDFLVKQGVKLRRAPYWPDYYDDRPGGSAPGRTVTAQLFDLNELGEWKSKLRPTAIKVPVTLDKTVTMATFNRTWKGKFVALEMVARGLWGKLTGKDWATAGNSLQGRMLQAAIKAGVDLRVNAGVKSFIVEDGAVTGVVTEKDGREWRIGARNGVLVNAGGFAQNQEMRDKYMPGTSVLWTGAGPGDTGEILREMMGLGAATAQMEERVGHQHIIPPGEENTHGDGINISNISSQMDVCKPHSIVVDQTGVRYMNESGSYMEFCQNILARDKIVPASPSWWIVDAHYLKTFMFCKKMPGTPIPQEWFDAGFVIKGDTIEELASKINVDPAVLKATVDRFNANAREGKDPDFHRGERAYDNYLGDVVQSPTPALAPVDKPPYYATRVYPGDLGTYGGVVTDDFARVLREDGSVIPGLYATGTSTASVMGRYYPGAGSSVGPSFVWGYVAAKHASGSGNTA